MAKVTKAVETVGKTTVDIRKCTCKHEFQDQKYGALMRVMNACAKGAQDRQQFRCTVCGAVH